MNIIPSTDNTEEYLKQDDVIDYSSEIITCLAGELIGRTDSETQFIKAAYEFVRDKISHSADNIGFASLTGAVLLYQNVLVQDENFSKFNLSLLCSAE